MNDIFKCELDIERNDIFEKFRKTEKKFCLHMEDLWIKMFGEHKVTILERYNMIHDHLHELFDEMLEEERERYENFRTSIKLLLDRSKILQKELCISIHIPFEVNIDGINLQCQYENLKNYLEKYEKIREERISSIEQYIKKILVHSSPEKKREELLSSKLGCKPLYNSFKKIPSKTELNEIEAYLLNLEVEKETRYKKYLNSIKEVKHLLKKLNLSPQSDFENYAISSTEKFLLSTENMEKLQNWKNHLISLKEVETKLIIDLKEKIRLLWERLDVNLSTREQFLLKIAKMSGKSLKETLMKELNCCEELKKLNIENVVQRLREEILTLWDKCHISAEERNKFSEFYSLDYSEELLELHEEKVESLTQFYTKTSNLYCLAEKWFELWNKMLSLESQSNNVSRLNNRGGQLLKEERERKWIQKELPKVETKLEKLVNEYECSNNEVFLYDGQPLMQLISLYWDNRRLEKENEKEVRKIQNATKLTPLKNSSNRSVIGPSPAFSSSRKRNRPLTPVENSRTPTARRELKMPSSTSKIEILRKKRSKSENSTKQLQRKKSLSHDSLFLS